MSAINIIKKHMTGKRQTTSVVLFLIMLFVEILYLYLLVVKEWWENTILSYVVYPLMLPMVWYKYLSQIVPQQIQPLLTLLMLVHMSFFNGIFLCLPFLIALGLFERYHNRSRICRIAIFLLLNSVLVGIVYAFFFISSLHLGT